MKFQVDNITVNILDTSPPSTPEEDMRLLAQYVYCITQLGIRREKQRKELLKIS